MKKKNTPPPREYPPCSATGCLEPGEYKAPKSRYETSEYRYLCLKHVQEFNAAWNYFDGWDREQIENFMHEAPYGHRPTWKIGAQPLFTNETLRDSFFKMMGEAPPKKKKALHVPQKERV